ncbi:hypothetical protein ACFQ3W_01065 [Paenibacillus puldeungensis]|uniref:Polymerase nucleotidyl transferase domain-containing protein n=1 Tax=Paenibacillus puldeungensis TaxID=696536 RepID=A0ABW3RSI0_9BACL
MNQVIDKIESSLKDNGLLFNKKPIVIGGMAMEYYGMRKSGADIDLIISSEDYLALAEKYPDQRKDIYGDLGMVIGEFEIWRSIALLDYNFFLKDAIDEGNLLMVSLDRLLLMRVCAMEVEKYKKDLITMKEYYYEHFRNQDFLHEAEKHSASYDKSGGTIFGGKYID